MRPEDRRTLARWLEAGAPEPGPAVDAAWSGLLAELPEASPSPLFAERVMARVALVRREVRAAARDLRPRYRWLLAVCLALVGASALGLPLLLGSISLPVSGMVDGFAVAVKAVAAWAVQGLAVWSFLVSVGGKVSLVLATPQAITLVCGLALVSAGALRLLFELTRMDRRTAHAAVR